MNVTWGTHPERADRRFVDFYTMTGERVRLVFQETAIAQRAADTIALATGAQICPDAALTNKERGE